MRPLLAALCERLAWALVRFADRLQPRARKVMEADGVVLREARPCVAYALPLTPAEAADLHRRHKVALAALKDRVRA